MQAQILQQLLRLPNFNYGCAHCTALEKSRDLGGMGKDIIAQRAAESSQKLRELQGDA
jgi:hypothetical protein